MNFTRKANILLAGAVVLLMGCDLLFGPKEEEKKDPPIVAADAPDIAVAGYAAGAVLAFGDRDLQSLTTKTLTIANNGTADLTIASIAVSGVDAARFAVGAVPSAAIAAGATADVTVSYTPTANGANAATLTIASNDADTPAYAISLTGTGITPVPGTLWYVKQPFLASNGTTTTYSTSMASGSAIGSAPYATLSGTGAAAAISVHHYYSGSGNVFKAGGTWNYANNNAEFLVFPTMMSGDFSVTATINAANFNKVSTASGIGIGMFNGFEPDSFYALNLANTNGTAYWLYNSAAGAVNAGGASYAWAKSADYVITFRRVGDAFYYSTNAAGSTANAEISNALSYCVGCTGDVYVGLAFGNVDAAIKGLVIKNADGNVVFDLATGSMEAHVTPSLKLSAAAITVDLAETAGKTITAAAVADGGAKADVILSGYDAAVCTASVTENAGDSTITILPVSVGNTAITVTNAAAPAKTKTIAVTISSWSASDAYGPLTTVYPADGALAAYTDGELSIAFDSAPTLNAGGYICVYNTADGVLVDTIKFAGESMTVDGTTLAVGSQMVRVSGNSVYFQPHLNKLAYGGRYYVAIPKTSITATLNGVDFNGFTNVRADDPTWGFACRAAPSLNAASVTVDGAQLGDAGAANFRTVQGALSALATGLSAATAVQIDVAAGTYRELVRYTGTKAITLQGPAGNSRGAGCVVTWQNYDGLNSGTAPRPVAYFKGCNLTLKNLTFANTWPRTANTASQAESIYFASGAGSTLAAYNCSFKSCQDTVQTSGRAWFYDCYIEGNTDFIWGTAEACLIENSDLYCVNDGYSSATAVLFVARTGSPLAAAGTYGLLTAGAAGTVGKGYVLLNSTVTIDDGISALFARDAGTGAFYDQVALVNVVFRADAAKSADGVLGTGLWSPDLYTCYGDGSFIGWKKYNVTGLTAASDTAARANTATLSEATYTAEYSARDLILNRVVSKDASDALSYAPAATVWTVSPSATFGIAP